MKRLGFILVLMWLSLQGWGQGALQYFNVLDDFHGKGFADWGTTLLPLSDSTYLLAGDAQDSVWGSAEPYVYARPTFTIISESGVLISKREYFRPYEQLASLSDGLFIRTTDGGYAISGIWQRWVQGGSGCYYGRYLLKLNSELDSTWMALDSGTMVLNQILDVRKMVLAADGGYILAGANHQGKVVLTKFDASGVHLWNRILPYNQTYFYTFQTQLDGNILMTGQKYYDSYMVKFNQDGYVVWDTTFNNVSPSYQNGASALQLSSGGYFVYDVVPDNLGYYDMHFMWWDASMNLIQEQTLEMEYYQYAKSIIELSDGSIVLAGQTGADGDDEIIKRAFLLKLSPNGELAWLRTYYWWYAGLNPIESCALAHDNGFILTGSSHDSTSASSYQDTWILKVDSVGCPFPDCGPSLGIHPPEKLAANLFLAYPSPASTRLHLKHGNGGTHEPCSIRLLSIDGKQMDELLMPAGFEQIDFDVSRFPVGLYLWEYRDAQGRSESGRFEVLR